MHYIPSLCANPKYPSRYAEILMNSLICIQFSSYSQVTSHEIIPMQLDSYSPLLRFLIFQVLQQSHLNLHRLKIRRISKVKSPPSRSTSFPKLFFGWRMFCLYIICHPQSRKTEKAHYYRSVESRSWVIA
jgi:hypothetical protein